MGSVRTRAASVLVIALAGCSDSSGPLGSGNRVSMDVDASSQGNQSSPPSGDADAPSADSPFAPLDGQGQYGALVDGYAPLAVCAQCACAAGTYCYGGSSQTSFSGVCDQTAATGGNSPLAVGCNSLPPGCANEPDCVCVLAALAPMVSCYLVCAETPAGGFSVYCPP
jgi:hypothetical protein